LFVDVVRVVSWFLSSLVAIVVIFVFLNREGAKIRLLQLAQRANLEKYSSILRL